MREYSYDTIQYILNSSGSTGGFPPSFEGNFWIFSAALFCTFLATIISVTQIFAISKEMRRIPDKMLAPINVYRWMKILSYLTVMFAITPDAIYLWTFGEVSAKTTSLILNIDRMFDALFIIPFTLFTWLQIKCSPVIKYQLIQKAIPFGWKPDGTSSKYMNAATVILMLMMSIGVTFSK
jgi:hypothetical protein